MYVLWWLITTDVFYNFICMSSPMSCDPYSRAIRNDSLYASYDDNGLIFQINSSFLSSLSVICVIYDICLIYDMI